MQPCYLVAASRGQALLKAVASGVPDAALLLSMTRSTPAVPAGHWSGPRCNPAAGSIGRCLLEVPCAAICRAPAAGPDAPSSAQHGQERTCGDAGSYCGSCLCPACVCELGYHRQAALGACPPLDPCPLECLAAVRVCVTPDFAKGPCHHPLPEALFDLIDGHPLPIGAKQAIAGHRPPPCFDRGAETEALWEVH